MDIKTGADYSLLFRWKAGVYIFYTPAGAPN